LSEFFFKLKSLLTKQDKQFLFGLLIFSILISAIETVGISIIMPFIEIASDFSVIHENEYYRYIFNYLSIDSDINFVLFFGIFLIFFYILRSLINLLYFYLINRFTEGRYHLLAYRLFESYLGMSYKNFVNKNSSILTKAIINEAGNLTTLISSVLFIVSEMFVVIFIYSMMIYINYKITFLLTIILIVNAGLMVKTISLKIKKAGVVRDEMQKSFYEIINKSFSNFKLIKLHTNEKNILNDFFKASEGYASANILNNTLVQVPRLFLEAIGFSVIIFIILYLVYKYENDVSSALSLITMFVLALYRLMPSANRIMSGYNKIIFYLKSLDIVHNDIMYDVENLGTKKITFENKIILNNVYFEYDVNNLILKNINIEIKKGDRLAFIGESGSGKSTLIDILIGLYRPSKGEVLVDDVEICDSNIRSWRSKVGYIPQSVYLFDGTVGDNVAFGAYYDGNKIDECLKTAKIYDYFNAKEGKDTHVGEGGIMLSGGQKQRIAIARALYTDPEILVLDEATSALDQEIESKIMDEIYDVSKDKTLIIIAHRLSTIERCEKVYKINNGYIQ